jgi:hypothetical protein
MKRLSLIAAVLLRLCVVASAQFNGCPAGFCAPTAAPTASYQGPGDIVSGFLTWGSCARVYTASLASTSTSLCDLVDSAAPTVVICTLRGTATGFVDLVGAYCTGSVTPATKCAAATGGVCNISQVYDQTGHSHPFTQTTAASQPSLVFSALNGLPGMNFGTSTNGLLATGTITQAQPFTFSAVYKRVNATPAGGIIGSDTGTTICAEASTSGNTGLTAGTLVNETAADAAFHSINDLVSSTSSAINVDGTDTASLSVGTNAFSSNAVRIGRCNGATLTTGSIMEAGILNATTTSTQRNSLSTNQHGSTGYNF